MTNWKLNDLSRWPLLLCVTKLSLQIDAVPAVAEKHGVKPRKMRRLSGFRNHICRLQPKSTTAQMTCSFLFLSSDVLTHVSMATKRLSVIYIILHTSSLECFWPLTVLYRDRRDLQFWNGFDIMMWQIASDVAETLPVLLRRSFIILVYSSGVQPTWHPYKMLHNLCSYCEHVDVEEDWRSDSRIYTTD
jgi:hypothetical protein